MNQMIICDCVVNIFVFALILPVYTSIYSLHNSEIVGKTLCGFVSFLASLLFSYNRLVPVGIVLFRYIMVSPYLILVTDGACQKILSRVKISDLKAKNNRPQDDGTLQRMGLLVILLGDIASASASSSFSSCCCCWIVGTLRATVGAINF